MSGKTLRRGSGRGQAAGQGRSQGLQTEEALDLGALQDSIGNQAVMALLAEEGQAAATGGADGEGSGHSGQPPGAGAPSGPPTLRAAAAGARAQVPGRERMAEAFGADFGGVRAVLGGPEARAALDAQGANAATLGDRVVFRDEHPDDALVAHELSHTLQQGAVAGRRRGGAGGDPEAEAHAVADEAAAGRAVEIGGSAPLGAPQFDLRDSAREQHEARGKDDPAGGGGSLHARFVDHDDQAPEIHHDHGFLDDGNGNIDESKREDPTWSDYASLALWTAKLEAAEALRPDLIDGTAAYRHFLFGGGATRDIDYQRFIDGDSSGATVLASALEDARQAAVERHDGMIQGQPVEPGRSSFRMRTDPVGVGNDGRYPYPATENWQKAIGAHTIWLEMDVDVEIYQVSRTDPPGVDPNGPPLCTPEGDTVITYGRRFSVSLTLHMEDMYNFNPGAADIATGTPDSANGRFEITGLGNEYLNRGSLTRDLAFETTMEPAASGTGAGAVDLDRAPRTRLPDDSRPRATAR
ncbi:MAG: DUF4157 domain-containing protein [Pseudomonadota bacterium]